jgi:hypothetical protein
MNNHDRRFRAAGKFLLVAFFAGAVPWFLLGTGSEGLTLSDSYTLPAHFVDGTEYEVDTQYCQDPTLTGEGWIYALLTTDSSGDVILKIGIPPWNPDLTSFTFCGNAIGDWDDVWFQLELASYDDISGGNKLQLEFDVPTTTDDLVVTLTRNTPKFIVQWDGNAMEGVAMPMLNNPFDWDIE